MLTAFEDKKGGEEAHLFMHEWQIESLHVFDDFIKEGQFYDSTTRILDLLLTTTSLLE